MSGDELTMKILLVEDNEMNRDMLSRRLLRKGFEVVMAVDGGQAVSMAESEHPDLILVDRSLPVIDGWEATRRVKAAKATAHIPIIALTAHAMSGDREKALSAGCDDYDTKPIEMPRLLEKIDALLVRPRGYPTMAQNVTEPDQRLERALAAFVRQDFGAPIATIIGLTEILIEDAQRNGDDLLVSDFDRIHAAGLLLQEQLSRLVDLATQNPFEFAGDFGAFKAKLRHDLRTPLNAVKGYGELIIEDARDNGREDLLADIGKLMDAADQLLGRIDKLFGVTDASGLILPETSPLVGKPSRDLVDQVMQSIHPVAPERRRDHPGTSRL